MVYFHTRCGKLNTVLSLAERAQTEYHDNSWGIWREIALIERVWLSASTIRHIMAPTPHRNLKHLPDWWLTCTNKSQGQTTPDWHKTERHRPCRWDELPWHCLWMKGTDLRPGQQALTLQWRPKEPTLHGSQCTNPIPWRQPLTSQQARTALKQYMDDTHQLTTSIIDIDWTTGRLEVT